MQTMTTTEFLRYDAHVMAARVEFSIAHAPKDAHCRARNVQICEIRDVAADAFEQHGSLALTLLVLTESGLTLEKGLEILSRFERASLPQVGEILVSSWGYDQTNIDYYQVTKVTKASVQIRKIAKSVIAGGRDRSTQQPRPLALRRAGRACLAERGHRRDRHRQGRLGRGLEPVQERDRALLGFRPRCHDHHHQGRPRRARALVQAPRPLWDPIPKSGGMLTARDMLAVVAVLIALVDRDVNALEVAGWSPIRQDMIHALERAGYVETVERPGLYTGVRYKITALGREYAASIGNPPKRGL